MLLPGVVMATGLNASEKSMEEVELLYGSIPVAGEGGGVVATAGKSCGLQALLLALPVASG